MPNTNPPGTKMVHLALPVDELAWFKDHCAKHGRTASDQLLRMVRCERDGMAHADAVPASLLCQAMVHAKDTSRIMRGIMNQALGNVPADCMRDQAVFEDVAMYVDELTEAIARASRFNGITEAERKQRGADLDALIKELLPRLNATKAKVIAARKAADDAKRLAAEQAAAAEKERAELANLVSEERLGGWKNPARAADVPRPSMVGNVKVDLHGIPRPPEIPEALVKKLLPHSYVRDGEITVSGDMMASARRMVACVRGLKLSDINQVSDWTTFARWLGTHTSSGGAGLPSSADIVRFAVWMRDGRIGPQPCKASDLPPQKAHAFLRWADDR